MTSSRIPGFLAISLAVLWAGCSSSQLTRRPTSMAEASSIIAKTEGRQVQVTIATPRGAEVHRGIVAPLEPGRFLLLEKSGARSHVPFEITGSISYTDHGRGALDGFLIGTIPGFALGFLGGFCADLGSMHADPNDNHKPSCPMNAPLGLALGLAMGLFTGAVGAGIGAGVGHTTALTF